uniref:ATP-dependent zinc metalloprotease FTSH 1, chloroplastic n=1 Tax=Anthurium amnicola TaxID=1678845 RepID=A0A1D1YIB1_9ARAE
MMACISALLATPCPPKGPNPSVLRASPSPAVAPFSNAWMTVPVLRSSKFRCWSGASPPPPAPPPVDSGETDASKKRDVSPYSWCAGLGALGFLETCYLTFLKVTDSEAFCPVGGGSCGDVLNSDYAVVFGIPLPLYGTIAYGFVALLGLQLSGKKIFSGLGESDVRLILLGCTTSMATASAYFLYLLSTKLSGALCPYCLFSAVLSFSLFFITVKDFGFQEIQKTVGVQLAIAGIVVAALSYSYSTARSQLPGLNDIDLQPFETVITTESTPFAISLAKHLRSVGAKMYGAFWCSHCIEQKQMFGREAMKIVDYVECFPDGFGRGRKMVKVCTDAGIEGFPTWLIRNQVLSGEQELSDLAQASGFVVDDFHPS